MSTPVRITRQTRKVLAHLLASPFDDHYGFEITRATGVPAGTLYPMLQRLEAAGWVESSWEQLDPSEAHRPARHHYRLTINGLAKSQNALSEATEK